MIAVLSIGTANTMLPIKALGVKAQSEALFKAPQISSLAKDIQKISTTILADPPDSHTFLAHLMLGGKLPSQSECPSNSTSIIRLNSLIQPDEDSVSGWKLPAGLKESQFKRLVDLDMDAIVQDDVDLIVSFCDLWMQDKIRNQSIHAGKNLSCEIGFSRFSDAIAIWVNI